MKHISFHLLLLCLLFFSPLSASAQQEQMQFGPEQKIRIAEQIIERFYADSLNADKMVEEGIVAMLKTLDPHSTYTDSAATRALTEPLEGNFSGVGIQFNMLTDTLYVISTVAGGPSERVGILPGDRILMVGDTLIAGVKMSNDRVIKMLRGPKSSKVNVKVKRTGVPTLIDFTITRDDIPINSVDAAYMAAPEVGYIRLTRFAESSAREVADAINKLRKKGMRHLILDLQSNGGGYLGSAIELASMMLPKGATIVSTSGMRQMPASYDNPQEGPMARDGRIIVMVDQNSASASEILAGALQDHDRGIIVGRRTFGKGLVQRAFPLPDGSMIRLTTAHYYTPSGRSIQKPYKRGDNDDYYRDIINRLHSGELMSADSIHLPDSLVYLTSRLHRPVYGGGGVMPDRFVPLDTAYYTPYYRDIVAKGILNRYSQSFVDSHRKDLKKQYPTVELFIEAFEVTEPMMSDMIAIGEQEKVDFIDDDYAKSAPRLRSVIKGLIARDLYDMEGYYRVVNTIDPIFIEALRIATDPAAYSSILPD
ncbi:MAG: S41 family peptidase [Pseudoflavonifractor sp.]|nr:S41 family peptidase [Alloprevotella sp.]MCM1115935.1 S41 family peptidase [Pseudoflavonifractor sp.]